MVGVEEWKLYSSEEREPVFQRRKGRVAISASSRLIRQKKTKGHTEDLLD